MKVLIATDGSSFSDAAVKAAAERAWSPGTQFRALTVIERPAVYGSVRIYTRLAAEGLDEAERVAIEAENLIKGEGRVVTHSVREGASAVDEIIAEAKDWGADLIFVGTHGRHGISRYLLGSVSERLANYAPCSIEIVRKQEEFTRKDMKDNC
jgi:nucleotide-binding universal stress UspA family protein